MSETETEKPSWREDPLSMMLLISAVILGGLFWSETNDRKQLELGIANAKSLAEKANVKGCVFGAVGSDSKMLALNCDGTAESVVAQFGAKLVADQKSVAVIGQDRRAVCAFANADWNCDYFENPTSDVLRQAGRKARRVRD